MIGIALGTRPEWLKIKPVVKELKNRDIPFKLFFTGQHETLLKHVDFDDYFHVSDVCSNRLDNILHNIFEESSSFDSEEITLLMVQGDTASAFACALAAFHRKIPVVHLEAGLRTNVLKEPFPEEGYRQMISCIASLHLCPTEAALRQLTSEEKIFQSIVKVTGNTVLDNIRDVQTTQEKKVLVTMHRRENHERLAEWFVNINMLAQKNPDYEFLLPIHPNPEVLKHQNFLTHVNVVAPMEHDDLVSYLASCEYVITDSGGIQEEACYLRKPTIVCRKETERREGLGNFSLLCHEPGYLATAHDKVSKLKCAGECPYGDGYAAVKVVNAIEKF